MPAPPMTAFGAGAYDWLEPIQADDAARGYVLGGICGAVGEMFRQTEELVRARPGRQPWQQAFDIDACPDFQVRWLGQLVGVTASPNVIADVQRAQVRAESGFWRGGIDSLRAAVAATLTGARHVVILERFSDAWTIELVTYPAETPNPTATAAAAAAATVAGLALTVVQRAVPVIDDGTRTIDGAAAAVTIDAVTFADVT